jgi:hypothetical protein
MAKKICKEDENILAKPGKKADFECKICGAKAKKEKMLCKPKKI